MCGFLVLLAVLCGSCERPVDHVDSGRFVARIGVPEANLSTADSGLMQIASLFSMEGLTERGFDGRVLPRLAERWTTSADGLRWRFSLRKGVVFHDGSPVTAADVVDSLKRGLAAGPRQGFLPGLADVVGVTVTASNEIEIALRRRSTFLLEDLDYPIVRRAADKPPNATGAFKTVSSGPTEIVMDRHDGYYQGRPELERIVIRPYATVRTGWASLMRGEMDVLVDLSRDAAEFVGSSDVALFPYLRRYVYVIALNGRRRLFSTPVRRALNAAIDREALIRSTLRGQGLPASGPMWPHHWAYDAALRGYTFDPSLAGAALDAAGHRLRKGANGRVLRFTFTCLLPQNWLIWERVAIDVQKQLYDVGVDMQLQMVSAEEYDQRMRKGDFDAVMVEMMSGPTLSRPYAFWRWGGEQTVYNVFGYRNTSADRWWDAIRSAPSDAEYRAAAGELQRTMLDDPPALFLAWSRRTRAITRRFNIPVEEGRDPMNSLWRATRSAPRAVTTH